MNNAALRAAPVGTGAVRTCIFGTRGDSIKKLLWRTSIARILIVGFFLLVLLPALLADFYFFRQIYAYILQEQSEADRDTVNLIAQDIRRRADEVEEFTNNIVYNGLLINFLQVNCSAQVNVNYEKYLYFVEYLQRYGAYNKLSNYINQHFFMVNNTIPEGFGSFYRIFRIQSQEWYTDLIQSGADSKWIYADTITYYDHITDDAVAEDKRFIYLRVVRNYTGGALASWRPRWTPAISCSHTTWKTCIFCMSRQERCSRRPPEPNWTAAEKWRTSRMWRWEWTQGA